MMHFLTSAVNGNEIFNYLVSSGLLYAIVWRLSRRWLWRLERMVFRGVVRLALLAGVAGAVWWFMK